MTPDNPRSHHKRSIAENKAPKEQDAPLTQEEFEAEMRRLTERARADGLNPIHTMAHSYLRQGLAAFEGFLASLENADSSTKKKA